jgi:hypothetical protein
LQGVPAEELSAVLQSALGAPVRIEGVGGRRVSLTLERASARAALDQVAAALNGMWAPVFMVERLPAGTTAPPGTPVRRESLGRSVSLRVAGVSAKTALNMVARAAAARLAAPEDLTEPVTLQAIDLPVEEVMDQLADQIGATWRTGYVVTAGPADPTPRHGEGEGGATPPAPSLRIEEGPGAVVPLVPLPGEAGEAVPATPRAEPALEVAALRWALTRDLARLLQTDPAARRPAARAYAARLEQMLQEVASSRRLAPLRPFFRSGLRAFGGLTPDQKAEFRPVIDCLRRWMP